MLRGASNNADPGNHPRFNHKLAVHSQPYAGHPAILWLAGQQRTLPNCNVVGPPGLEPGTKGL